VDANGEVSALRADWLLAIDAEVGEWMQDRNSSSGQRPHHGLNPDGSRTAVINHRTGEVLD
jgi:hypothetical protein